MLLVNSHKLKMAAVTRQRI